jgi:phosphate transport system permease protein
MSSAQRAWEWFVGKVIQLSGAMAIVFVILIFAFLLRDALPLVRSASLREILLGDTWLPTSEPPKFSMLPLLLGSLYVTVGALIIAVPLGLATAAFISEVAPRWIQEILKPTVEILASIPSVVFGFLGLADEAAGPASSRVRWTRLPDVGPDGDADNRLGGGGCHPLCADDPA